MAITRKFYELKNEVEENLSKSDRKYVVSVFEDVLDHIFISSIKELVDYVTCFKCLDDYCILEMKITDKLRHKVVDKEFKVFLYNVVTLCGLNGLDCSNVLSFNVIKIFFKLKDVDLCQRFKCDRKYVVSIFEDVLDHIFISSIKELVDYVTCFKCLDDYCILEMKVTDKLRRKVVDKDFKVFLYNVAVLCGLNGLDCSNVLDFNVIKIFYKLKNVDLCQRFKCDKNQLTKHVHYVNCGNEFGVLIELDECVDLFILKEYQLKNIK